MHQDIKDFWINIRKHIYSYSWAEENEKFALWYYTDQPAGFGPPDMDKLLATQFNKEPIIYYHNKQKWNEEEMLKIIKLPAFM